MEPSVCEKPLTRWASRNAALHSAGVPPPPEPPQLVSTRLPEAPPTRKWTFQNPTSPGVSPAMLTSSKVQLQDDLVSLGNSKMSLEMENYLQRQVFY